jgi:hypothetical protein
MASGQFKSLAETGSSVLFKPVDFARLLEAWRAQRPAS